jgi:hypothetical protein
MAGDLLIWLWTVGRGNQNKWHGASTNCNDGGAPKGMTHSAWSLLDETSTAHEEGKRIRGLRGELRFLVFGLWAPKNVGLQKKITKLIEFVWFGRGKNVSEELFYAIMFSWSHKIKWMFLRSNQYFFILKLHTYRSQERFYDFWSHKQNMLGRKGLKSSKFVWNFFMDLSLNKEA